MFNTLLHGSLKPEFEILVPNQPITRMKEGEGLETLYVTLSSVVHNFAWHGTTILLL